MSERLEFVTAAGEGSVSLRELCRRFAISEPTGRKWRRRYAAAGATALGDRSRRPLRQPARTAADLEEVVCDAARAYPAWGPRKLRRRLIDGGVAAPAASTIQRILERHGVERLVPSAPTARSRFVAPAPNALWQMDFKGHFPLSRGGRCHPLTVLDDHSRFNVVLHSCGNEQRGTVQEHLTGAFRRYGLPERILTDNGAPWGYTAGHGHTRLSAWLIRLDISIVHGRPYHPQTQGKDERFHRTLALEVLDRRPSWSDLGAVQDAFDAWRRIYNHERPHEALALATPATVYRPSPRPFPEQLPEVTYDSQLVVRRVRDHGEVTYQGKEYLVGRGFTGELVALHPVAEGVLDVYYCRTRVAQIDQREGNHVSEH